jgi:hypothetical protein
MVPEKTQWCHFQNMGHPEDENSVLLRDIAPYLPNYKGKGKGKIHPRTGHEGPEGE